MAGERPSEDQFRNSEAALGGADSVQKTTALTGGSGSDPDRDQDKPVIANVPTGGGVNLGVWAVVIIAVVIALIYGVGAFR